MLSNQAKAHNQVSMVRVRLISTEKSSICSPRVNTFWNNFVDTAIRVLKQTCSVTRINTQSKTMASNQVYTACYKTQNLLTKFIFHPWILLPGNRMTFYFIMFSKEESQKVNSTLTMYLEKNIFVLIDMS